MKTNEMMIVNPNYNLRAERIGNRATAAVVDTVNTVENVIIVGIPNALTTAVVGTRNVVVGFCTGVKYAILARKAR